MNSPVVPRTNDPWTLLKAHTSARIGIGRSGAAILTGETLRFKLAHAQARDAVHAELDEIKLKEELTPFAPKVHCLRSAAGNRLEYLQRPDFGRRLDENSKSELKKSPMLPSDLAIVLADGLSPRAIENHSIPFLRSLLPMISDLSLAPIVIVHHGRVAIGDEIAESLEAKSVAILIGERPGLSSPDSMGVYMTYAPRTGLTDERRNCISNIRLGGLTYQEGAEKLTWLLRASFARKISGVELKDEMGASSLNSDQKSELSYS